MTVAKSSNGSAIFIAANSYPPTIREIGAGMNISSTGVVEYHLKKLEREGFIRRTRKLARSIVVVRT